MSEEQNDSPAFRLRPRRAAPKSYYTVRLEYSANPNAFIRERPRTGSKRKVLSNRTGSNSTKNASMHSSHASAARQQTVITKEEREQDQRRMMLHRGEFDSLTTGTMISPFLQRLRIDELKPNSTYEHNYITMKIKRANITGPTGRSMTCFCQAIDDEDLTTPTKLGIKASGSPESVSPDPPAFDVMLQLMDSYANPDIVKDGKIISVSKFKTGPSTSHLIIEAANPDPSHPSDGATSSGEASSTSRRPLVPFVCISDMIEQPTEPYVEMSACPPDEGGAIRGRSY